MPRHDLVPDALARRVRTGGGAPLLTHYGADGARTELSVASFANWADKTAHLLADLGLDAAADVALPVLVEAPGHWMALVWPFGCWRAGVGVRIAARADAAGADLAVVGPVAPAPLGETTLVCSLRPWGRPLADLPDGVADFAVEALAMPDGYAGPTPDAAAPAWTDADGVRTHADLAAFAPLAERVALRPGDARSVADVLVRAVVGGGSVVVVEDAAALAGLAAAERARVWAAR